MTPAPGSVDDSGGWLSPVAWLICLGSLLGFISASGIWDPHELRVAELARRIAVALLGAESLSIPGADNSVPNLGDLARGQLPFTSIALGFRLFGLHEWAGRLPLALWGIIGAASTYLLVARLLDRRAGAFAVIALSTMPLYFVQARTMLGEIVTMAALAMTLAGLMLACFDPGANEPGARRRRAAALGLGVLGLAAGFGARGLLIGVSLPLLAVALTSLAVRDVDRFGRWIAGAAGVLGLASLVVFAGALRANLAEPDVFSMLVGVAIHKQAKLPTFDAVLQQLGHGLFPWSAIVPVAAGRLLLGAVRSPAERALRACVMFGAILGFAVHGLLLPITGALPFVPLLCLAAIVAVACRDFERDSEASRAAAMVVACLSILLYLDFRNFPEKGLVAFVVADAKFPESFAKTGAALLTWGTLLFVALYFGATFERSTPVAKRFDRDEYLAWPRALRELWGGNLWFFLAVSEVVLILLAVLRLLSESRLRLRYFETLAPLAKSAVSWGFLLLPLLCLLPLVALFARDLLRTFFSPGLGLGESAKLSPRLGSFVERLYARLPRLRRFQPSRAATAVLAAAICGGVLSFGYYPALAAQISPREVFESYRLLSKPGESLGMVGVEAGTATYYARRSVPTFEGAGAAFSWLMDGDERRWLVIRARDLPQINALYRARQKPPANIAVLDSRSSEIMLVSSRLLPGEHNQNPLNAVVSSAPPPLTPSRKLDANLGNQLEVLGWDVQTLDGKSAAFAVPNRPYQFVIYYRVQASITGNWETFVHIDGYGRRHNADHPTLGGRYPLNLWRAGDHIADRHEFTLEPNFTPGMYSVFFGLFIGSRRLEVQRGSHHENRIRAGLLEVR